LAYGYVLRSFSGKEYRVVSEPKAGQLLFGWESFDGGFSFGVPIILVEGAKDAIFAQMVHPYSLAFLSSDLTKDTLNYLCKITDRFILAVDSDASGDKHRKNLHRELGLRKCRVADIIPQGKDLGEYFRNKEYNMRVFRQQLSMAFKKVEYNDSI
jgi:DNA primase